MEIYGGFRIFSPKGSVMIFSPGLQNLLPKKYCAPISRYLASLGPKYLVEGQIDPAHFRYDVGALRVSDTATPEGLIWKISTQIIRNKLFPFPDYVHKSF